MEASRVQKCPKIQKLLNNDILINFPVRLCLEFVKDTEKIPSDMSSPKTGSFWVQKCPKIKKKEEWDSYQLSCKNVRNIWKKYQKNSRSYVEAHNGAFLGPKVIDLYVKLCVQCVKKYSKNSTSYEETLGPKVPKSPRNI